MDFSLCQLSGPRVQAGRLTARRGRGSLHAHEVETRRKAGRLCNGGQRGEAAGGFDSRRHIPLGPHYLIDLPTGAHHASEARTRVGATGVSSREGSGRGAGMWFTGRAGAVYPVSSQSGSVSSPRAHRLGSKQNACAIKIQRGTTSESGELGATKPSSAGKPGRRAHLAGHPLPSLMRDWGSTQMQTQIRSFEGCRERGYGGVYYHRRMEG